MDALQKLGVSLPRPGHVFEKKYRIEKLLGSGGFARVYLANFEDLKRRVAIKILVPTELPPQLYSQKLNARFLREAQVISDLRNPATVTMHDFGRSEEGLLYMVFEFVDGKTIEELLRESGPMDVHRTARITEQVLRSLDEAHARGILHRDIKPANIMVYDYLDDSDLVKLLDFGIAKPLMRDQEGPNLTRDNAILGTPRYMSPEQIVNEQLSGASDLYSLGLVAFEMLMGEPALASTDRSVVIRSHLAPEPFTLPPDLPVPPDYRYILEKMVAKKISDRFQSAKEALSAIDAWRTGTLKIGPASTPAWGSSPTLNPDSAEQVAQMHAARAAAVSSNQQTAGFGGQRPAGFSQNVNVPIGTPQPQTPNPAHTTPGFGASSSNPNLAAGFGTGNASMPNAMVSRPAKTKVQVEQTPTRLTVHVPPVPTPRDLMFVGASVLVLLVGISFLWAAIIIGAGVAVAFFVARLLSETSLVIDRNTGYEIVQSVLGYDRAKRGPIDSVLRLTHTVDDDDMATLKVATHDGDRHVARNLSKEEAAWLEATVNGFLEASRGPAPQPQ